MIVETIIFSLLAVALHEVCHYGFADALNLNPTVNIRELHVDFQYQDKMDVVVVLLAPVLTGLLAFVPFAHEITSSVPILFAWSIYTFGGWKTDILGVVAILRD